MEHTESRLSNQLKHSSTMPYPDFEKMWSSVRQNELRVMDDEKKVLTRSVKRKRTVAAVSLSVALAATPVYAALTYDWSDLLSHRSGIHTALEQGLGQTIEQSFTEKGVTLTLHTAFTDENQTFLLYSLDPGPAGNGKPISFQHIGLRDENGSLIEGNSYLQWNEELHVYQGYFETDWVMDKVEADMEFFASNIQFEGEGSQIIDYQPNLRETQLFNIRKDGIDTVKLQSFEQAGDQTVLKSITSAESYRWVRIEAVNAKGELIQETKPSFLGAPEAPGEYSSQQTYSSADLLAEGTTFYIKYDLSLGTTDGTWSLDTTLSKKQLENGSFKEQVNVPVKEMPGGTEIADLIVTPTQVRLLFTQEQYEVLPYIHYQLDVGGKLLDGGLSPSLKGPTQIEMRFDMAGITPQTLINEPITLIAKHRRDMHNGDKNPVRLTDISAMHQTVTSSIEGFPVTWTYYLMDGHLYVESQSTDPAFGGVNQTYYLDGEEIRYGRSAIGTIADDGSNHDIDIHENFKGTEVALFVYSYSTSQPEQELRVQIK